MGQWRLNLYILIVGQFLIRLGMTGVKPYFGLFLPEIGVTTPEAIAFWAGLVGSINFLSQALLAPVWGNAADRYGKKMMVIRCAAAIGIINLLTAAVGSVYQLVFLRFTLGVFAGYNAAALALIASSAPKEKMGYAVGLLQTGQMAGTVFGPAVGGLLSQFGSYRLGFIVAGIMGLIVVPVIMLFVKEPAINSAVSAVTIKEKGRNISSGLKFFRASPFLLLLLFLVIVSQFSSQGMDMLMPLFVDEIYSGEYLDLVVAIIFALTGLSTVIMGPTLGKLGDQHGHFKIVVISLFGMGVLTALQSLVVNEYQLGLLRFTMGLFIGGLMPNLNALIANRTPANKRGIIFGVTSSANSIGNFLGPFTSGIIASMWGIRSVLIITAALLLVCTLASTSIRKIGGLNMIQIDHFGICAKDTEKLADWYVNVLGFKVIRVNKNKTPNTYFIGDNNGCQMEIFGSHELSEPLGKNVQGLRHIALVPENFDEYVENLIANNVTIIDDVKISATGSKTFFFRDLEGNILHLLQKA